MARRSTLGPVRDLAAHVHEDWWRHAFDAMYLKTDGDVVDDPPTTAREIDALLGIVPLTPAMRILDLCCGHGRHSLELARRGFANVEGLDASAYLLGRARRDAKKERLAVSFRAGDARAIGETHAYDAAIVMGNSFGYFQNAEDDAVVLRSLVRALRPGAPIFLDIADGEALRRSFEPRSWEWIAKDMFVCRERHLLPDGRMVSREIVTKTTEGVVADRFYAERLYTREELAALFERCGFTHFTVHREVVGESTRNQDLGMMAHRLFVTAKAPRARGVVVILGDPKRPDAVKPTGRFDTYDRDAVDRLIAALGRDRAVRILADHRTLLDELRAIPADQLVMNLCDEGFDNHPQRELHVPALLDMLGLRYTGAGPACLARCHDKSLVRGIARELGIPVAPAWLLSPGDEVPAIDRPVIVKPNHGDGSFGIDAHSVARTADELAASIAAVRRTTGRGDVLVEELLVGAELGVGIVGNPPGPHRVLPIVEEDFSVLPPELPKIIGYRAKWDPTSPYWKLQTIAAQVSDEVRRTIVDASTRLFARLECRDYARFDWRLDERGRPHLLEVNPNPGWCWDGHLARMAQFDGLDYPALLDAIVAAAEQRVS